MIFFQSSVKSIDLGGVDDISFIYKGKHVPTGKLVSLIYTDLSLSLDLEFIQEMQKTVSNNKNFNYSRLLHYECSFIEKMRLWCICTPLVGTFKYLLTQRFPQGFQESQVAAIIKQVLEALVYLHGQHVIHNDIKAGNIVLLENGSIQLTGTRQLCDLSQKGEYKRAVFSLVGDNIEWAAPEIMAQNANYNEKADIYSIGITCLELLFHETPFDGWEPLKVLYCKTQFECPMVKSKKAASPHFLSFVKACVQKDFRLRPCAAQLMSHPFLKSAGPLIL